MLCEECFYRWQNILATGKTAVLFGNADDVGELRWAQMVSSFGFYRELVVKTRLYCRFSHINHPNEFRLTYLPMTASLTKVRTKMVLVAAKAADVEVKFQAQDSRSAKLHQASRRYQPVKRDANLACQAQQGEGAPYLQFDSKTIKCALKSGTSDAA